MTNKIFTVESLYSGFLVTDERGFQTACRSKDEVSDLVKKYSTENLSRLDNNPTKTSMKITVIIE